MEKYDCIEDVKTHSELYMYMNRKLHPTHIQTLDIEKLHPTHIQRLDKCILQIHVPKSTIKSTDVWTLSRIRFSHVGEVLLKGKFPCIADAKKNSNASLLRWNLKHNYPWWRSTTVSRMWKHILNCTCTWTEKLHPTHIQTLDKCILQIHVPNHDILIFVWKWLSQSYLSLVWLYQSCTCCQDHRKSGPCPTTAFHLYHLLRLLILTKLAMLVKSFSKRNFHVLLAENNTLCFADRRC